MILEGPTLDLMQGNVATWLFTDPADPRLFAIHAAIMIALIWPNLAITTKRAHDRDTNGYWLNGVLLISYATFFLPDDLMQRSGAAFDRGDWIGGLPMMMEFVFGLVMLTWIVILGFLDGSPAANRYGPSPKGGAEIDVAEVFD